MLTTFSLILQMKFPLLVLIVMMTLTCGALGVEDSRCNICVERYLECLTKNKCELEINHKYIAHCKRQRDECVAFCIKWLKKVDAGRFPVPWWGGQRPPK